MQSAWDSVGQRKPQNQAEHKSPPSVARQGGATAASSSSFKLQEDQVHREADVMGAEALVCVPHKGNNVSSQMIFNHLLASVSFLVISDYRLVVRLHRVLQSS